MRFKPDHSEKTKAAIVAAAGRLFRRDGYDGTGVDAVAAEAGMTSGAVYSQFGSKRGVLLAVLRAGLEAVRRQVGRAADPRGLEAVLAGYFSPEHRDRPADGCLLPCLSADAARAGPEAQALFAELLPGAAEDLETLLASGGSVSARDRAWTTLAMMAGGVMLARALPDGPAADELLAACRRVALYGTADGPPPAEAR